MQKMAWIMPIVAGIGWGIVGVFIRILTDEGLDNVTIVTVRAATGIVLTLIYLALFDRGGFRIRLKDLHLFLANTVAGVVLLMMAYNIAVVELSLSLAAVLLSTAPAFVLLISAVLFKEKITRRKVLCMLGALLGCVLLTEILETGELKWSRLGLFMGVSAMVLNGVWILISKVIASKGYGSFTVCFYSFVITVIILAPFTDWGAAGAYIAAKPVEAILVLVGQSLCTSLIPMAAYIVAMRYLEAGKTAILEGGSEPAGALIIGFLLYGEMPSLLGMAGMVLVVVALGFLAVSDTDG